MAFRSLSRLSSALSAKASSLRSLQLNLPPHSVVTSAVDLFLVFFVSQFPDRLSLSGLFVQTWPRMSFFFIQDLRFCSIFGFQGTMEFCFVQNSLEITHLARYFWMVYSSSKQCLLFRNGLQFCEPSVGLSGLEPPTSRLSGVRSNRLSYKPSNLAATCSPIPSPV